MISEKTFYFRDFWNPDLQKWEYGWLDEKESAPAKKYLPVLNKAMSDYSLDEVRIKQ